MITIPTMEKGATAFLITGDASRNKIQTMPGGGFATVAIDLPAAWDSLTTALGYLPLSNYQLEAAAGTAAVRSTNLSYRKGRDSQSYNLHGRRIGYRHTRGVYIQDRQKRVSK